MSASSEKKRRLAEREQGIDKRAEAQREAEAKAKKSRLKWRLGTAAIALFVVLSIVLNTSLPFQLTAVKVGNTSYSAAEMNYFYNNAYYDNSSYMSMFGVSSSLPLDSQECMLLEEGTWHDYLLQQATSSAQGLEAIYQAAVAAGFEMSDEAQEAVDTTMESLPEYAEQYGYKNVDKYLQAVYGSGITEEIVREMITKGNLANEYANSVAESFTYSDDELMAYYEEHIDEFVTYDYQYYYIAAETESVTDEEGNTTSQVVEGGVDAAKAEAEKIAAKVTDADSFAAAVAEYSEGATVQNLTGYPKGSINSSFSEWIVAEGRTAGDVTVATSDNGAYVVMYAGMDDNMYNGLNMRHILIKAVDEDGDGVYSDEEKAAAEKTIKEIEAMWLAGEQTEEAFAALAEAYSEDAGSVSVGGLYEGIGKGDMVTEIDEFLFANGRQVGDTAILHGNNGYYDGYHLVYFAGTSRDYRLTLAENAKVEEDYEAWEDELIAGCTVSTGMGYNLIGK